MAKGKIINIDEGKCDGRGFCVSSCPEGALEERSQSNIYISGDTILYY